jgi:uncharacterized protein (TIGR02996 family)
MIESDMKKALIRAILEDPEDDTPRWVYADWLEECGEDPARAEFIRVQLEAWKLWEARNHRYLHYMGTFEKVYGRPITYEEAYHTTCSCDWCSLRRREGELLKGVVPGGVKFNVCAWSGWPVTGRMWAPGPVPRVVEFMPYKEYSLEPNIHARFRRGFIQSITLNTTTFHDYAEHLFSLHPVEEVTLSDRTPHLIRRDTDDLYGWWNSHRAWDLENGDSDDLPSDLHKHLDGEHETDAHWCWYRSIPEAQETLSRACVKWARMRVGTIKET